MNNAGYIIVFLFLCFAFALSWHFMEAAKPPIKVEMAQPAQYWQESYDKGWEAGVVCAGVVIVRGTNFNTLASLVDSCKMFNAEIKAKSQFITNVTATNNGYKASK